MNQKASTPEQYIAQLPADRQEAVSLIRNVLLQNLPEGFAEEMSSGMIGYVVPKTIYPEGYHVNRELPLPFISIASQKNHIAVYHMGLVANTELLDWFLKEYAGSGSGKPDMGKSCIRFKNLKKIPYELIGRLAAKMTPEQWVSVYTKIIK